MTDGRRPILTTDLGRKLLRLAFTEVRSDNPFRIVAIALLPDHLHTIWELPAHDHDYSMRWRKIKSIFTRKWRINGGQTVRPSLSRVKRGEHGVWQRRFFEHTCRDETDLKRCLDDVHVNPLKHGLVERVRDWPWSTFHRYVREGEYSIDWGNAAEWYGDEFNAFE